MAPSKVKQDDLLEVAETVLMQKFVDENALKIHVTSKLFIAITERNLIHEHSATFVENVNHHRSKTLRLRLEEAAGYTILGNQAGFFFATVLSKELAKNFFYQNQYVVARNSKPGNNPSTDTAVLILNGNYKKIVYGYKPVVHPTMDGVDVLALTEALLQANYVLRYYKVTSVLQSLTDLETWHYFKFSSRTTSLVISIDWYHKVVQDSVLSISDIENHLFM